MIRSVWMAWLGCVMLVLMSGCGADHAPKDEGDASEVVKERLVGRIHRVNSVSSFVLIRRYGSWHVGERDLLESRGADRRANLLPTGERLGEHIAADIRSGKVEVGDAVYVRHFQTKEDSPPSPFGDAVSE